MGRNSSAQPTMSGKFDLLISDADNFIDSADQMCPPRWWIE